MGKVMSRGNSREGNLGEGNEESASWGRGWGGR